MQDELRVSGMASFTLRFILLRRLAKLGFVAWLVFLVLWGGFALLFLCVLVWFVWRFSTSKITAF